MHVNILEINASKRMAGLPETEYSQVECLREIDEREANDKEC